MDREQIVIRQAAEADVRQIADILVEDWQKDYRGIIDDGYLDAMDAEERYRRELRRYRIYTVAAAGSEILGFAWNELSTEEPADCEIIALYVRYGRRKSGVGRALFRHSAESFRAAGKKAMIVWCLKDNAGARRFYEKMGREEYRPGTHPWGSREYEMISYLWRLDSLPAGPAERERRP